MPDAPLPLLNVYEVEFQGEKRFVVCLLEPVLAGSRGIDERSTVGEFTPAPDGGFQLESFRLNPVFITALTEYMNTTVAQTSDIAAQARQNQNGFLYLLDPRCSISRGAEPNDSEVVGSFAVDSRGLLVPGSFHYNEHHLWFSPATGVSGLLADRKFYDWLHPETAQGA